MPKTPMREDDFFAAGWDPDSGSFSGERLRQDLLRQVINGPLPDVPDIELCDVLADLTHAEFTAFATGKAQRITDADSRLLLRAYRAVCTRAGIAFPDLPFRDLEGFKAYWVAEGMAGSYAKRRRYLEILFEPIEEEILNHSVRTWSDVLVSPVSPRDGTGWETIDAEILQLRQRFAVARTDQDHCAVGAACVRVLEHLGEVAFDPAVHLPAGAPIPSRDRTKDRFQAVIAYALPGPENDRLRKLARSVVEQAQVVKHSRTPSRRDAGIAADSVIMLVNLLRRLVDQQPCAPQATCHQLIQFPSLN
jgi:hypothetical protein